MRSEIIAEALGMVGEDLIADASPVRISKSPARKRTHRILALVAVAACLCLVVTGTLGVLSRSGYFKANCGSFPGTIVDGFYYYKVPHDGVYRYSPEDGSNEKIISDFWEEGWSVDEYGLYYQRGRSLYVIPHDSGRSQKLYTGSLMECTHIGFSLQYDGTVFVTLYNKHTDLISEVRIDGKSGEFLGILSDKIHFLATRYANSHIRVGERELELVENDPFSTVDLQENGRSILPEGYTCYRYPTRLGDGEAWLFSLYREDRTGYNHLIVHADGTDIFLDGDAETYYIGSGTADYLFTVNVVSRSESEIWCVDTRTGEGWMLESDRPHHVQEFVSDGVYAYTSAPWDDIQSLWKLGYDDDGRPVSMTLIEENIIK